MQSKLFPHLAPPQPRKTFSTSSFISSPSLLFHISHFLHQAPNLHSSPDPRHLTNGLSSWQDPSRQALGSMKLRTQAILASMVGLKQCAGSNIQVSMAGQVPVEKNFCLPTVSSKPSLSRHSYPSAAWLGKTTGCGPRVTRGLPDHTPPQLTA